MGDAKDCIISEGRSKDHRTVVVLTILTEGVSMETFPTEPNALLFKSYVERGEQAIVTPNTIFMVEPSSIRAKMARPKMVNKVLLSELLSTTTVTAITAPKRARYPLDNHKRAPGSETTMGPTYV